MQYHDRFSGLPDYVFPRLRSLLAEEIAGGPELSMSIGEPRLGVPETVGEIIAANADGFSRYPPNEGLPELRRAIASWILRRYGTQLDPETEITVLNGSREGLFAAGLALSPMSKKSVQPVFLLPNPFYQCYWAAALAAGAEPVPVAALPETGFLPDFLSLAPELLNRTSLCYVCSPSNPQGAIADPSYWSSVFDLAEQYNFLVIADECYSELYRDSPPVGALEVVRQQGHDINRIVSFQSLSKRSSAPGLRSGFAAGGSDPISRIRKLRSYGGAPVPVPLQIASAALWNDEEHVANARAVYSRRMDLADEALGDLPGFRSPRAGFFLWVRTGNGEASALRIYQKSGVRVLPGGYLGSEINGLNPGSEYIRAALVADDTDIERGLSAIRAELLETNKQRRQV